MKIDLTNVKHRAWLMLPAGLVWCFTIVAIILFHSFNPEKHSTIQWLACINLIVGLYVITMSIILTSKDRS